ncbi:cupin domain-containing protein [Roseomonas sp. CCTCC AB2023176]|uniref:cupin domain-containing protein n=1 Tax=Roseomonas sp. CCTCC AB2023176 TaxID=3342640 RepID=UPI0035D675FF
MTEAASQPMADYGPGTVLKRATELRAFRIAPSDTNYFALLLDPIAEGVTFTLVVEIFAPGGATPPNSHAAAHEVFFVLRGEGVAISDGQRVSIAAGDTLLLPPGSVHVVENTGPGKLYCLTMMQPNEGFAELTRAGTPVDLDEEDVAVLTGALVKGAPLKGALRSGGKA